MKGRHALAIGLVAALAVCGCTNAVRQKTQELMKKNWEAAGFAVEIKSVPADVFFSNTSPDGANHFWADVHCSRTTAHRTSRIT